MTATEDSIFHRLSTQFGFRKFYLIRRDFISSVILLLTCDSLTHLQNRIFLSFCIHSASHCVQRPSKYKCIYAFDPNFEIGILNGNNAFSFSFSFSLSVFHRPPHEIWMRLANIMRAHREPEMIVNIGWFVWPAAIQHTMEQVKKIPCTIWHTLTHARLPITSVHCWYALSLLLE